MRRKEKSLKLLADQGSSMSWFSYLFMTPPPFRANQRVIFSLTPLLDYVILVCSLRPETDLRRTWDIPQTFLRQIWEKKMKIESSRQTRIGQTNGWKLWLLELLIEPSRYLHLITSFHEFGVHISCLLWVVINRRQQDLKHGLRINKLDLNLCQAQMTWNDFEF